LVELEASRASRKRAWENLAEMRWVLKDSALFHLLLDQRFLRVKYLEEYLEKFARKLANPLPK
jgi:hypothetical protein